MAGGFGLDIQAVDARSLPETPSPLSRLVGPPDLGVVAAAADFLVVTVPLVDETLGMIDRKVFDRMRATAYLVSVSRGEVIVEEDLYRALSEHRIAGAAIDTWYQYPRPDSPDVLPSRRFPFHELDNLVLSPHRAGFARGELPHLDDAIENLNRFAAGKELINIVDLSAGY
jgi:phosphoglycerate dehydrogenase-like enzyme